MDNSLYETLCNSNIDYIKFVKEYIDADSKVKKLKELDNMTDITEDEKLIMYLFIEKTCTQKLFHIRKCDYCKFEWFSTKKYAYYCMDCRL